MSDLSKIYTPNESVSENTSWIIIGGWVVLWLGYWTLLKPTVFPTPFEVLGELPDLWFQEGLGQELITSFTVNLEALVLSALISLPLAYLSLTPLIRPIALAISKLRFLSPAVFFLLLLFATNNGHQVKVLMLTLGETFFLVTTVVGVVGTIPSDVFDDARTLRMNEWTVTWYVVIRGTVAQALDAIRDNAAMGWSMLMMVEGFVRSEGGVGVLILNQERHMNFAVIYAVALAVVIVGLLQDAVLVWIRRTLCPYAI
jgi:NitT/TauT family transport system permease protein